MTDVVQEEQNKKMNAQNIAMVFATNMTLMSDPLTALMHVVQVMNFLQTLILKTLRDCAEVAICDLPDEDGYESMGQTPGTCELMKSTEENEQISGHVEFAMEYHCRSTYGNSVNEIEEGFLNHFGEKDTTDEEELSSDSRVDNFTPSSSADDEVRIDWSKDTRQFQ